MRQAPAIEAYGGGGFRVAGLRIEGSILIVEDRAAPWPVATLSDLKSSDFDPILAADRGAVEFVLLGLGPQTVPPPKAVREAMRAAGLGLEVMDTVVACKLYNVLASEGRRIAAALIAV